MGSQYCTGGACQCRPGTFPQAGGGCGDCSMACPGGLCQGNSCVTACPTGTMMCGAACVDLQTSPLHCGACDQPCAANEVCVTGRCREYHPTSNCSLCAGTDFRSCCTYGGDQICVNADMGRCP